MIRVILRCDALIVCPSLLLIALVLGACISPLSMHPSSVLTCDAPLLAIDNSGKGIVVDLRVTLISPGQGSVEAMGGADRDAVSSFKLALIYASVMTGVNYKCCNYLIYSPIEVKGLSGTLFFYILLLNMLKHRTCLLNITSTGIIGPGGIVGSVGGFQEKLNAAGERGLQIYAQLFQVRNASVGDFSVKGVYSIFDVYEELEGKWAIYDPTKLERHVAVYHEMFEDAYRELYGKASSIITDLESVGWVDYYLSTSKDRLAQADRLAKESEKYYISSSLAYQALVNAYASRLHYLKEIDKLPAEISTFVESALNGSESIISKIEEMSLVQEREKHIDVFLLDLLSASYQRAVEAKWLVGLLSISSPFNRVDSTAIELCSRSLARTFSAEAWLNVSLHFTAYRQEVGAREMGTAVKYVEEFWYTTKEYLSYMGLDVDKLFPVATSSQGLMISEFLVKVGLMDLISNQLYSSLTGIEMFASGASIYDVNEIITLSEELMGWVENNLGFIPVEPALTIDLAKAYLKLGNEPTSILPLMYTALSKLTLYALFARAVSWLAGDGVTISKEPFVLSATSLIVTGVLLLYVSGRKNKLIIVYKVK